MSSIEELDSVVAGAPSRKRQKMCLDPPSEENTAYALLSLSSRKSSKKDEEGTSQRSQRPRRESSSKRDVPRNVRPRRVIPNLLIPDVDGILVSDDEDDDITEVTCSSNKRSFHHALHGAAAHRVGEQQGHPKHDQSTIAAAGVVMPQPYFGRPLALPPNLPSVPAGYKFTSALIR
jgi:hypothetical protein